MTSSREEYLNNTRRIVVKVGSSTLTYPNGRLNFERIESIVRQIADIHNRGIEVILVTSGAVGAGMGKLGLKSKPKTIPQKQAAASVGQGILINIYEKIFSEYGKTIGQILLTRDDFTNRIRFLNANHALHTLLNNGVIPVINENDSVVVDEIKFGDNDTLSALVASLIEADLLVLLSDIDGFYDDNPAVNKNAKLISYIDKITDDVENAAGGAGSKVGTGGMYTKIQAAKIAVSSGISMVIANGAEHGILYDILDGKDKGTWFQPDKNPLHARERWIAFSTGVKGKITIDSGAEKAIIKNKSLLASGITDVEGCFGEGQVVSIINTDKVEIARGVVNYNSMEISNIKGLNSSEIEDKLGYKYYDEIIHINNMVVLKNKGEI
jgi:glutamate 5-kinase